MASQWIENKVRISNARGLHARAAAKFVKEAASFKAEVEVIKDGTSVNGSSIMGLLMLAASMGTEITIRAGGTDAKKALTALTHLVERRFDEE